MRYIFLGTVPLVLSWVLFYSLFGFEVLPADASFEPIAGALAGALFVVAGVITALSFALSYRRAATTGTPIGICLAAAVIYMDGAVWWRLACFFIVLAPMLAATWLFIVGGERIRAGREDGLPAEE